MLSKICGLTTAATLDAALAHGASHVGFVFFAKSPRNIAPDAASALVARAKGKALSVGLLVNPDMAEAVHIARTAALDIIQLHGDETPAFCAALGAATGLPVWKAVPVSVRADLDAAAAYRGVVARVLYDAKPPKGSDLPGGTGLRIDWSLLQGHRHAGPWILAGGLDPVNVAEAVRVTGADFVDVSSGVESAPGIKDVDKIAAFCQSVRDCKP